jgi:RNA polymerase sigma-70 factor (ECF subfamily)
VERIAHPLAALRDSLVWKTHDREDVPPAADRVPKHEQNVDALHEPTEDPQDGDQHEIVRRALQRLPVERREVLVLSRFEFKSYEEIAVLLDCSVGAVKVRAHRALKQLREIYLNLAGEVPA